MTKLLTLGILFLTASIAVVVAKLVMSGILSSISFVLALYISFLTTFFTTSLNLLKLTGTGNNLSTSNLPTLLFKLRKLIGTFFSL